MKSSGCNHGTRSNGFSAGVPKLATATRLTGNFRGLCNLKGALQGGSWVRREMIMSVFRII
jgi:hypothetical protein